MSCKVTYDFRNLGVVSDTIEKNLMDRCEVAAELIATRARQLCPVGTTRRPPYKNGQPWSAREPGTLRGSIRVTRLKGDPNLDVRVYAGSRTAERNEGYYAHMVEYGSVHNVKKAFLRPAAQEIGKNIETIMTSGGDVTGGME
jgi:hypothetical protein